MKECRRFGRIECLLPKNKETLLAYSLIVDSLLKRRCSVCNHPFSSRIAAAFGPFSHYLGPFRPNLRWECARSAPHSQSTTRRASDRFPTPIQCQHGVESVQLIRTTSRSVTLSPLTFLSARSRRKSRFETCAPLLILLHPPKTPGTINPSATFYTEIVTTAVLGVT